MLRNTSLLVWGGLEKGVFPVKFLSIEKLGKIGMHAKCGTHSLIMYLREWMKKATVAAKRRKRWVGGECVGEVRTRGKREVWTKFLIFNFFSQEYHRNSWLWSGNHSA